MDRFLDAADNYQKSRALNVAKDCYEQVELIALQLEKPNTIYLGLAKSQVQKLLTSTPDFQTSFVLARAYKMNNVSEWVDPLYNQVIEHGNFDYFTDFTGRLRVFCGFLTRWKETSILVRRST